MRLGLGIAAMALGMALGACAGDKSQGSVTDSVSDADGAAGDDGTVAADVDAAAPCPLDHCAIGAACFANGEADPANPCAACLAVVSRVAFTPNDAASCDDGSACTQDDACVAGACVGAPLDCDDGDPCTLDACDEESGACASTPAPALCGQDPCAEPSLRAACDDANPCTADGCTPWVGCVHAPVAGDCDDADACTTGDTCVAGACAGAEAVDCDDDDLCTIDVCRAEGGCVHTSIATLCADDNPCTDERCDAAQGCVYPFNAVPCDDANACTANDTCAGGACLGAPVDLNDLNPCTDDACDPLAGVTHTPNVAPCDDASACTLGDTCGGGVCHPGLAPLACDDRNGCTDDRCEPAVGCVFTPNTLACEDGSACTAGDTCADGVCLGAAVDCDDANACTLDRCDPATGCAHALIASNACRPTITVTSPARGATLQGVTGAATVTVSGTVVSGAGPITSFTINGVATPVDPATGAFSRAVPAQVGGNLLVIEALDALGSPRRVVQSFLWSTAYRKPTTPMSGAVTNGVAVWLDKLAIDDGQRSLPPNDLGTILELALKSYNFATLIPSPAASNVDASIAGKYNIYLKNLTYTGPRVTLTPRAGGLALRAVISSGHADIEARKTCSASLFSCWGPGTITGDITFSSITIDVNLNLGVASHDIVVTVASSAVSIAGVDVQIDGVFGWLAEWVLDFFLGDFVDDIEAQFNGQIAPVLGPLVRDALRELAFATSLDIPRVSGAGAIGVDLVTDYERVAFDAEGGRIYLRAGAFAPKETPYDNRGVPDRVMCGSGAAQSLVLPEASALELALADDTLNSVLFAAWRGGLLEFAVPAAWLAGTDLGAFGISDLSLTVTGMLAPTASDCGGGGLKAHIGDLRVEMSLALFGQPLTGDVWVSAVAGVEVSQANGQISVKLTGVDRVETQVDIAQEGLIGAEEAIRALIQDNLVDGLMAALGGTELGAIPLPDIDLSGALPSLPPNTRIRINPQTLYRQHGTTIVGGTLN